MGAYYGIVNLTKKHKVSSYWKGSPPFLSEVITIAKKLKWCIKDDIIISGAYDNCFFFKDDAWIDFSEENESENHLLPFNMDELEGFHINDDGSIEPGCDSTFFFN